MNKQFKYFFSWFVVSFLGLLIIAWFTPHFFSLFSLISFLFFLSILWAGIMTLFREKKKSYMHLLEMEVGRLNALYREEMKEALFILESDLTTSNDVAKDMMLNFGRMQLMIEEALEAEEHSVSYVNTITAMKFGFSSSYAEAFDSFIALAKRIDYPLRVKKFPKFEITDLDGSFSGRFDSHEYLSSYLRYLDSVEKSFRNRAESFKNSLLRR